MLENCFFLKFFSLFSLIFMSRLNYLRLPSSSKTIIQYWKWAAYFRENSKTFQGKEFTALNWALKPVRVFCNLSVFCFAYVFWLASFLGWHQRCYFENSGFKKSCRKTKVFGIEMVFHFAREQKESATKVKGKKVNGWKIRRPEKLEIPERRG